MSGVMTARFRTGRIITARAPRISERQKSQIEFQKELTFVEVGGKIFAFAELPPANGEW